MDFPPPDCHTTQSPPCVEADWVPCAECARLICTVHDDPVPVRHAGKYAANTDNVCADCAQMLFERGELSMIRSGFQFINRR
jgi:hypothetical protein